MQIALAAPRMQPDEPELEAALAAVEQRLHGLGRALRDHDATAIELEASELHRTLAAAVQCFAQASRRGAVLPEQRRRLAHASGQVAAQRDSLARATAALDRAIDVLLPQSGGGVYAAAGGSARSAQPGHLSA